MRQLILVGACYLDTIISVPHYPEEDTKLRATSIQVRRGGNCPNALEVLQQLVEGGYEGGEGGDEDEDEDEDEAGEGRVRRREPGTDRNVTAYLISSLPAADSPATRTILDSFGRPSSASASASATASATASASGPALAQPFLHFEHCLYREGHLSPASCYILRSAATGSRTSVNDNRLPDMTADEFATIVSAFSTTSTTTTTTATTATTWWHFEGRIPGVTLACIRHLRQTLGMTTSSPSLSPPTLASALVVSVELENPERQGLRELAAEADVVFYSKLWAQAQGYADAEACLRGEVAALPRAKLLFCTWGAQGASALACPGSHVFINPVPLSLPASKVVDSVGAGDTFVAGILYKLACHRGEAEAEADDRLQPATAWNLDDANVQQALAFAVDLATRKVQIDGFRGLADGRSRWRSRRAEPS